MNTRKLFATLAAAVALAWSASASAHCDTLDGPVVSSGQKALDSGNINLVLPWVRKADEPEIRKAFDKARSVRKVGGEARELADTYFYETLVRVHRAGEGAPYTGLKPAGQVEAPVAAADRAIDNGKLQPLAKLINERAEKGLHGHFDKVVARKKYAANDVEAGRAYTAAYVEFVHYAEKLYDAAGAKAENHHRH